MRAFGFSICWNFLMASSNSSSRYRLTASFHKIIVSFSAMFSDRTGKSDKIFTTEMRFHCMVFVNTNLVHVTQCFFRNPSGIYEQLQNGGSNIVNGGGGTWSTSATLFLISASSTSLIVTNPPPHVIFSWTDVNRLNFPVPLLKKIKLSVPPFHLHNTNQWSSVQNFKRYEGGAKVWSTSTCEAHV